GLIFVHFPDMWDCVATAPDRSTAKTAKPARCLPASSVLLLDGAMGHMNEKKRKEKDMTRLAALAKPDPRYLGPTLRDCDSIGSGWSSASNLQEPRVRRLMRSFLQMSDAKFPDANTALSSSYRRPCCVDPLCVHLALWGMFRFVCWVTFLPLPFISTGHAWFIMHFHLFSKLMKALGRHLPEGLLRLATSSSCHCPASLAIAKSEPFIDID
ncbi:hypothetical protein STEG23_033606, partial [Scotinomys teguina]